MIAQRLRHEYGILSELDLPCVIKAKSIEYKEEGSVAIVFEDAPGEPLARVLGARRLGLGEALTIVNKLAEAVSSIHRAGIIHKDICPRNILWDEQASALKVMGFGVAVRLSQEVESPRHPSRMEGTLAYMSPEQTGRMNRVLDSRTDLYSVGVTLYEMLTGDLPFPATDPMELVHSHIARPPAPPREKDPSIPEVVSDIVMKLLAKAAEDRYQSARGLVSDLSLCLAELSAKGRIEAFPLGLRDIPEALRVPQRLYGRQAELHALMGAFARVRQGATEIVLVSGYSGVGKTSLVNEIYKGIARGGGYLISGKFDQQKRDVPFAPVAHAFGELVRHLLAEPPEVLARFRQRILDALGKSAHVIAELLPELTRIIGPQPSAPEVGSAEAENRFALIFQRFLRVFTAEGQPLCIFLDDLQWADVGSLKLLHLLLTDPESAHLLVIAAYRDNEVDAAHPLTAALARLRTAGAIIQEILLKPLDEESVVALLADALFLTREEVRPLGLLLRDKTQGNPFFLGQLLTSLHAEGLIAFDAQAGAFRWDLARASEAMVTANVVDFMRSKLARLTQRTRRAVELAACIGYEFDLSTLSIIEQAPRSVAAADLWEALREGVIVPLDAAYRFLHESERGGPAYEGEVSYRFLHDGVQQAAYALIGDAHKQEVHLRIGRLMRDSRGGEPLFDVVSHLNLGASLLTDPSERVDLARRNLAAAERAKAGTAFDAAARYFAAGAALLDDEERARERRLAFALHAGHAQCASLEGRFDEARAANRAASACARAPEEQAQVHILEMGIHARLGRIRDAVRAALDGLAPFGVVVPETEDEQRTMLEAEQAELLASLAARPLGDPSDIQVLADPGLVAVHRLMVTMTASAYGIGPLFFSIIALKMVNLSRRHGHTDLSSFGYMTYALILSGFLGRPKEGYPLGAFALKLNERFKNAEFDGKLNLIFAAYILFFSKPLRPSLDYLARSRDAGLASGDFSYAGYACMHTVMARLALGDDLRELDQETDRQLAFVKRLHGAVATMYLSVTKQVIANLTGRTMGRTTLSDARFDEGQLIASLEQKALAAPACYFYTSKLELLFLHEDLEGALAMAILAEEKVAGSAGLYFTTMLSLFSCLALLGRSKGRTPDEDAMLARHEARILAWAEGCPDNFEFARLLIAAERAREMDAVEQAMELYDRAAEEARRAELFHREALVHELCAKFFRHKGRLKIARAYMTLAHVGYLRWGAVAKAEDLAATYPELVVDTASSAPLSEPQESVSEVLDATAVIRAAEAIAGEITLDKVLDRVMRIVLSSAGAQRGVLLLERGGGLFVEATVQVQPDEVQIGPRAPARERTDLAQSILHYVAHTHEPVVLRDAAREPQFAADAYIERTRPRSVLCLAMTHRGRLTGLLYLENNAAEGVFTKGRVSLLRVLCTQAAIAVEHALLVAEMQEANDAAVSVAQRAQLLEAQRTRIAELEAPLIPITDRIMVMPLIGVIDAERAERILETALSGAAARRATVVILDVTGVKQVDAGFAGTLLRTARALGLLGTQAMITGIGGEMAQALVELDVDLQGIVTQSTLQKGIADALARAGGKGPKMPLASGAIQRAG